MAIDGYCLKVLSLVIAATVQYASCQLPYIITARNQTGGCSVGAKPGPLTLRTTRVLRSDAPIT